MTAHHLSSGDLIADRRAGYARMLAESGDFKAAAELMDQALELVPQWAAGWFLLGEYHEKAGEAAAAIPALRRVLELNEEDIFGAGLKLSVLGERAQPDQPPVAYVEQLFDDYAGHFEEALIEKLDYRVPERLKDLILGHGPKSYACAIDLGCGTGLLGVEIASVVQRLEGYDLSVNMLAKAEEKAIYHHLSQADLSRGPAEARFFEGGLLPHRADLVAAADVVMYLGDLENLFLLARTLLQANGYFAFSVEQSLEEAGFHLQPSLRYAHTAVYIEDMMTRHGFQIRACERLVVRMDAGAPVHGIMFVSCCTATT